MVVFPEVLCVAGKSVEGNFVCDASSKESYRGGVRCKDEEGQWGKAPAPFSPFHCLAMLFPLLSHLYLVCSSTGLCRLPLDRGHVPYVNSIGTSRAPLSFAVAISFLY